MTMITNLILHRLKTHLTNEMMTKITVGDPTRAVEVKLGRFQESPLMKNVYVSISGGDQQDPELADGVLTVKSTAPGWQPGFDMWPREIGGGNDDGSIPGGAEMWWRRGRIQLGCFYVNSNFEEEVAMAYAYETLGRLIKSVDTCPVNNLIDSFGELAVKIFSFSSNFFESGGPPKQYIWRGSVKFQVLTERT